jgi:hypothetical protein
MNGLSKQDFGRAAKVESAEQRSVSSSSKTLVSASPFMTAGEE